MIIGTSAVVLLAIVTAVGQTGTVAKANPTTPATPAAASPAATAVANTTSRQQETTADRAVYNQLIQELRQDHLELTKVYRKAVQEARTNGGKADMETKAQVLSLRDRIDRKTTRLMLVAVRHGWSMPDFSKEIEEKPQAGQKDTVSAPSLREILFAPVDAMIQETLTKEAMQLATNLPLPVVTYHPAKK